MWGGECPMVGGRGHSSTHTHKKQKEREAGNRTDCVFMCVCVSGKKEADLNCKTPQMFNRIETVLQGLKK